MTVQTIYTKGKNSLPEDGESIVLVRMFVCEARKSSRPLTVETKGYVENASFFYLPLNLFYK